MIRMSPRRRRLVVMGLDNPIHIAFIVIILLLVFGAKRLPEIGRSLGTGMREFKDSVATGGHDGRDATPSEPPPPLPITTAPVALTLAAPAETIPSAPVAAGSDREAAS